ncbi:hypothetical protein HPB47_007815 [Ixodes persulcatus]|uniref:Uncharacterized protein n=1 Tax=Ixodes persulcatus TaxID=34615 RepID=A0AC60P6I7_IXOPE|nr:hypothetical protein HPB47_007815 [Ixodes persulcatus]
MARDTRLKANTQRLNTKRRRAWNKKASTSRKTTPSTSPMPQAAPPLVDATGSSLCSTTSPMPQAAFPLVDVAGPSSSRDRMGTVFYTEEGYVEREQRADDRKASLADQSATSQKFELLDVCMESGNTDRGTEYVIVDMKVLQELFASTACGKCGITTVGLSKCEERQYGLAVKLVLTCSTCDFAESRFSSPRVTGEAKITPFEINLRAMKGI